MPSARYATGYTMAPTADVAMVLLELEKRDGNGQLR